MSDPPVIVDSGGLYFETLKRAVHFELRKMVEGPVAFKVLSRFPMVYKVYPNVGVIEGPVDRRKPISVTLSPAALTKEDLASLANDVILIDTIPVNDVVSLDAPAPKKSNNLARFDWTKVTDRSKVSTLRIRSKLDPSLKRQMLEEIEAKTSKQDEENDSKVANDSQREEKRSPALDEMEVEKQPDNNDESTAPELTNEFTLVEESDTETLPVRRAAPELANFANDIRKIEKTAFYAHKASQYLQGTNLRTLPLNAIYAKVITAAQTRHALKTGDWSFAETDN